MKNVTITCLIIVMMFALSGCENKSSQNVPMPPSAAGAEDNAEITENIDSIIEDLSSQLGEPPEDVIGFCAGYKRRSAITPAENAALLKLFREKSSGFAFYDMGCSQTMTAEDMLTSDPDSENSKATGYGSGNNIWIGKAGFNKYDRLGNLEESINKTAYDVVSIDKTIKKATTENAQAEIDRGSIYAYWIISLPDDNVLEGIVYDKGADEKREPVKKGILHFERVGPGPDSIDLKVNVNGSGKYKTDGELTAGHYKVSFDPKDGKGEKLLNNNWLYIPGDTPTQDWEVLVRNTYQIIYDFRHTNVSDRSVVFEAHIEWHDIPIDWTVESEEAFDLGTSLSYQGLYCLIYEYFENNPAALENYDDNDDESETESLPGYAPSVLKVKAPVVDGSTAKITQNPTVSFFRGAKDGMYLKDAYYINLEYNVAMVGYGQTIEVPVEIDINPLPYKQEAFFEKQGWGILSRIARLDEKAAEALINDGTPLTISYTDSEPSSKKLTVVIMPED